MASCLDFQQVSKGFGRGPILQDLTLSLMADITTAIVGESGSGKSTLLQLANGLLEPDSGQVAVFGTRLTPANRQTQRLAIGYGQQGAGLFPHLTIHDNVVLMARLQQWSDTDIQARYTYLMSLLDLGEDLSDRYPYSLSGGQQQRVSLCRAMMLNPPLLLLDEPFSALDPVTRESIHREFLQLQRAETRSMVLVTHDMSEALKLAQRIVVLQGGTVVQHGTVAEIQQQPANDYVANFFAAGAET